MMAMKKNRFMKVAAPARRPLECGMGLFYVDVNVSYSVLASFFNRRQE
ncbi:hypothetical protein [Rhizobium sp.]